MRTFIASSPAWFESWFDTPDYHRLYAGRDDHEATAFVDRLVSWLAPAPDARMLDLGCGAGRHARALATHGFDVTGLDLAGETIRRAKQHETLKLRFVHHWCRRSRRRSTATDRGGVRGVRPRAARRGPLAAADRGRAQARRRDARGGVSNGPGVTRRRASLSSCAPAARATGSASRA